MSDPELSDKFTAEIEKIQRQRKAQGLSALTSEQANRLRTVISARRSLLYRVRAGSQQSGSRLVPLGMTILAFVLVVCGAVLSRILRR
jgi:hypothetical protein